MGNLASGPVTGGAHGKSANRSVITEGSHFHDLQQPGEKHCSQCKDWGTVIAEAFLLDMKMR